MRKKIEKNNLTTDFRKVSDEFENNENSIYAAASRKFRIPEPYIEY
jgi:hypothetical protein